MEVQFGPGLQPRLEQFAHESGRPAADVVHDAVAGYMEELVELRTVLDRRYKEIRSGQIKPIPGEEGEAHFSRKFEAARNSIASEMIGYEVPPEARPDLDEIDDPYRG